MPRKEKAAVFLLRAIAKSKETRLCDCPNTTNPIIDIMQRYDNITYMSVINSNEDCKWN